MRSFRLAIVALVALIAAPVMASPKKAPAPNFASYNWTGFYLGANGGGAWGSSCFNFTQAELDLGCQTITGGLGGGQFGYNWQTGNLVFGAEFSGDWANIKGSYIFPAATQGTSKVTTNAVLMATGRIGYAWDHALIYAKGGAAWAHYNYERTCNGVTSTGFCTPVGTVSASGSQWRAGWTIGAGVEYGLTSNLSLALEYAYVDLGTRDGDIAGTPNYNCGGGAGQPCGTQVKQNLSIVSARLNWRFGGL